MKRPPQNLDQIRMDGGPVQLSLLGEWRDLSAGQQPDPTAEYLERLANRPLPGQTRIPYLEERGPQAAG